MKLKKENIQGLILDLRYNGGGSMEEALDMAGIFIDEGPLSLIKDRTGKVVSLKDANRGTIYDGPLLVLVNGQSASASELLSAVLQDYNRAIIAGGNTYGKGSGQIILPVDTSRSTIGIRTENKNPEYGFVKVTVNKFYRVSGGTTQHQGVKPDIQMPDVFDELDYRESAAFHSLPADEVKRNAYYKPLALLPIDKLKIKSEARTKHNASFAEVKKIAHLLLEDRRRDSSIVSLKWTDYVKNLQAVPDTKAEFKKLEQPTSIYVVENSVLDNEKFKSDAYQQINLNWVL